MCGPETTNRPRGGALVALSPPVVPSASGSITGDLTFHNPGHPANVEATHARFVPAEQFDVETLSNIQVVIQYVKCPSTSFPSPATNYHPAPAATFPRNSTSASYSDSFHFKRNLSPLMDSWNGRFRNQCRCKLATTASLGGEYPSSRTTIQSRRCWQKG
jgi:hypothetical protein